MPVSEGFTHTDGDGTRCSRLAPSPTGPLHVGNACTFLLNWALARRCGWTLLLRIEDLDSARTEHASEGDIGSILGWLGIDHDGPEVRQRARIAQYEAALRALALKGLIYESPYSRSEVRDAAAALHAPHAPQAADPAAAAAFPRTLRPLPGPAWGFVDAHRNHRFRLDEQTERVQDEVAGARDFQPAQETGDFLVWTKAGVPSYQLAVVVDDAAQGVTDVVRGDDLLPSAAVQQVLWRALGQRPPRWWHLPLIQDAGGVRMAKRRGSASLAAMRAAGVDPARVVGLVGWWIGAQPTLAPMDAVTLRDRVDAPILRAWHARSAIAPPRLDESTLAWLHAS